VGKRVFRFPPQKANVLLKPSDIKLNRPAGWAGWIPTKSGTGFHPLAPKVEEVRLSDIAQGVSYRYRYGCQTQPYTVAEHCVLVSHIIELLWPESKQMLPGLLHDACEAYTHDLLSPVRSAVKVTMADGTLISWSDMERRINQTVGKYLGITPDFYSAPEVLAADILAVVIEKAQIPELQGLGSWGLPVLPPELERLRIRFWGPEEARQAFLTRYHDLGGPDQP